MKTRKYTDGAHRIIAAAQLHGENDADEPDHEVGDLQGALFACWHVMTDKQRAAVLADPHVHDNLIQWEETMGEYAAELKRLNSPEAIERMVAAMEAERKC